MSEVEVSAAPARPSGGGAAVSRTSATVEPEEAAHPLSPNVLADDTGPHAARVFDEVVEEAPGDGADRPRRRVLGRLRSLTGERVIGQLLRGGAVLSGSMFAGSLVLEALPQTQPVAVAIDTLRKGAASVLLVTPVVRVVAAGAMLGVRGEWRYTLFAGGILVLLAVAVGAGMVAH